MHRGAMVEMNCVVKWQLYKLEDETDLLLNCWRRALSISNILIKKSSFLRPPTAIGQYPGVLKRFTTWQTYVGKKSNSPNPLV